jgi:hypothetical protein
MHTSRWIERHCGRAGARLFVALLGIGLIVLGGALAFGFLARTPSAAAAAWKKPVFVVISGPLTTKLPDAISKYPLYPLSRLDDVMRAIRSSFEPLSETELQSLANTYQALKVPADEFTQSPKALHELTAKFNKHAHKQLSSERLLT